MFWTIVGLMTLALCITAILAAIIVGSRHAASVLEVRRGRKQRERPVKLPPFSQAIIDQVKK